MKRRKASCFGNKGASDHAPIRTAAQVAEIIARQEGGKPLSKQRFNQLEARAIRKLRAALMADPEVMELVGLPPT